MAPAIDEVLEWARGRFVRLDPEQAALERAQGALLVDTVPVVNGLPKANSGAPSSTAILNGT
jgi:hypothetical protein